MSFAEKLLAWFDQYGRKNLPWQQYKYKNNNPYFILVSEIMLQQTQVNTVIPYFKRFITKFPTVENLANAPLDEVLKSWEGLGYYARARNLHKTALIIYQQHYFPDNLLALEKLPGIGRSTAGAILSLAFNQPAPMLDGNVKRLFARYHGIDQLLTDKNVLKKLWDLAESYLPKNRADEYTQALMDFGSIICTVKNPACQNCIFNADCIAFNTGREKTLPLINIKNKKLPVKPYYFLIIYNQHTEILLEKRALSGIWGGLYCLPILPILPILKKYNKNINLNYIKNFITKKFKFIGLNFITSLPTFRHTLTHFHFEITPVLLSAELGEKNNICAELKSALNYNWYKKSDLLKLALPKPIIKILKLI